MAEESLTLSAQNHNAAYKNGESTIPWAISVFSHPSAGVADICREGWPILGHNRIRVSTVGALRQLGYDVVPDGENNHALIPVGPPPWDWGSLRNVGFQPAELNPEKERRRMEAE